MSKLSARDLLDKIDWEGGWEETFISYGLDLDEYDVPEPLRAKMKDLIAYSRQIDAKMRGLLAEVEELAGPPEEPIDDEDTQVEFTNDGDED